MPDPQSDLAAALPPSMRPMAHILTDELVRIVDSMMSRALRAVITPEDIAQRVRAEILAKSPSFEPRGADAERAFRSWLSTVVLRRVQDAARQAERLAQAVEDHVLDAAMRDGETPSRTVGHGHAIAFMLSCVSELEAAEREVLRLYYIEGLTFEQIDDRMDLARDSARRIRTRALKRLREMMGSSSNYSFGGPAAP